MKSAEHSVDNETTADAQKTQEVRKGDIEDTISNITEHSKKQRGSRLSSSSRKNFLKQPLDYDADTREMKKEFISPISVKNNLPLPDVMRFSSWCKLVRCTAKVLKFIRRCQKRDVCIEVSADELREAEKLWWKEVQNHCFPEELNGIGQNDDLKGSKLKNVSTYLDGEEILRVRSRISVDIPNFQNNPIILDGKHTYTYLLVQQYHLKFNHQEILTVINELRPFYWIVGLRNLMKKVWRDCQRNEVIVDIEDDVDLVTPLFDENEDPDFTNSPPTKRAMRM
ncbi:hypothetical protein JTB14_032802 [Gonioctena quinquepunctata]|nr:hypothetical protein JTB14_032802 [Gonioctena quinquepunctata]